MPPPVRRYNGDYHFHTDDYIASAPFTLSPAQPNRNNLRFYSMERDLAGLRLEGQNRGVPNIALANAGLTSFGRPVRVLSFGNRNNSATAPNVAITGGIHAREWIAPEIAYLVAEYLIINYTNNPTNRYAADIKALVDSRNIQFIPMQNPDGNHYTVFGTNNTDGMLPRNWRKNRSASPTTGPAWVAAIDPTAIGNPLPFDNVQAVGNTATFDVPDYDGPGQIPPNAAVATPTRILPNGATGVDLNRNFDTLAWGYDPNGSQWQPDADAYFGRARNSEAETVAVQAALAGHPPRTLIDYHAYWPAILYPSEAWYNNVVGVDYAAAGLALQTLTQGQNHHLYQLGDPATVIGYDATGTIIDYAAHHHATRAVTIELDPGPAILANPYARFYLPENQIRTVFERNIRGALAMLSIPDAVSRQLLITNFLTWNVWGRGNRLPS